MSTKRICKFVLERINFPGTVVLDKQGQSYSCGRAKDNLIVCPSLRVSRKHCTFFCTKDDLYVMDLQSSNGLYINGQVQKAHEMVMLHHNDIISIGEAEFWKVNAEIFAYRLKIIEEIVEDASSPNKSGAENSISPKLNSKGGDDSTGTRKRGKNNIEMVVPNKIPKLEEDTCHIKHEASGDVNNQIPQKSTNANATKIMQEKGENEECDIEIIHVSLSNDTSKQNLDHSDNHPIQSINANIEIHGVSKAFKETEKALATNQTEKENNESYDIKEEDSTSIFNQSKIITEDSVPLEGIHNKHTPEVLSVNCKNNIAQTKCSKRAPRGAKVIQKTKTKIKEKDGEIVAKQITQKEQLPKPEIEKIDKSKTLQALKSPSTTKPKTVMKQVKDAVPNVPNLTDDVPLVNGTIKEYGSVVIKYEDELQLTDTDEDANLRFANESLCAPSPLKLKKVTQEPKTRFSEVDVVNLSDDEDDIFPCSQLFDVGFGTDVSIKEEVKEEPPDIENDRFDRLDNADMVISLSDSEDENPWLERLSRSQIFNETDEFDQGSKQVKEEAIDIDTTSATNDAPTSSEVVANVELPAARIPENIRKEPEKRSKAVKEDTMQNNVMNMDAMNLSDTSDAEKLEAENIPELPQRKEKTQRKEKLISEQAEPAANKKEQLETTVEVPTPQEKRKSLIRKIPEIEPPHLPVRRRSSTSTLNSKETAKKSISPKLSTKEKKELKLKAKVEEHIYKKEQKHRKARNKWAECLPPGKKKEIKLTKEEKKALTDNRKAKLKEIAIEEKKSSVESKEDKKRVAKPKAKVSVKTRGDFLCSDQGGLNSSRSSLDESLEKLIPRARKGSRNKDISKDLINKVTQNLRQSLKLSDLPEKIKIPKKSTDTSNNENKSRKKRVTFCENIKTVREYEIDPENTLRKFTGKDAPIPLDKLPPKPPNKDSASCPKLEEFMLRIFSWNPVWLEEQRHLNTVAPVVKDDELLPMLIHYQSYSDYYKVVSPLLLLEVWCGITKEFETIDKNMQRPTVMCSIVENSIARAPIPSTNLFLTTLMLEVLVTKEDLYKQAHPLYGDLVFFEYTKNQGRQQVFHKVFAYVTNIYQTILTANTHYNKELNNYIKTPYALLTYTMLTRPLENEISVNRVQRLRAVTYLRANMRLVQALQYLPQSPLVNLILHPKINAYQLPAAPEPQASQLVTKDSLNPKQLEAVLKVTATVVQKEAKLCFVQGPPGTGKSTVIVNIVTQILYGDNRYKNHSACLRILVCAPSNAAIDEIVLRLLAIRATMKQKRFKMVRIGRPETMHHVVKDISITELAKREVKRTAVNYAPNNMPTDSVEEEKKFLEARMNALRCEIASCYGKDDTYKKHIKMKLADMSAKYELLKNRSSLGALPPKEYAKLQRAAENRLLQGADIITCTLSSCYTNQMESIFGANRQRISVCIVDEATQSCEAETLIPLMLGVNTLVLVGDTNQLPATIISQRAKKLGLDQSIFTRVQNAFDGQPNNPIILLDTQYRMDPAISYWPNKFFYAGKLKNATQHDGTFPFQPYRLLNLNALQNDDKFSNTAEAEFVANLILCMMTHPSLENWKPEISLGVLTPYHNQRSLIQGMIDERMSTVSENMKKKSQNRCEYC